VTLRRLVSTTRRRDASTRHVLHFNFNIFQHELTLTSQRSENSLLERPVRWWKF